MCYFVELNLQRKELEKRFGVPMDEDPRYMPAYFHSAFNRPYLPVITSINPDRIRLFQWGLIPSWVTRESTAETIRNSTYNAKSETLWEKPAFRDAARSQRCLVPAHGFFEYHTRGNLKIPYYIRLKNDQIFTLAGVYDTWMNPETGEIINSFSIITTAANPLLEKIHNTKKRMPVILSDENEKRWIGNIPDRGEAESVLRPFPEEELTAYTVSRKIAYRDVDIYDPELIRFHEYRDTEQRLF